MHRRFLDLALVTLVAATVTVACHPHKGPHHPGEPGDGNGTPGLTWTALDPNRPAGTPAEVKLDLEASSPSRTTFDLAVSGFWVEEKKGPDGRTYQKIEIPGLGSVDTVGAPDLPLLRFDLAIPTGAQRATLAVELTDVRTLPDYRVWPQVGPERDHAEGDPERFVLDPKIYDGQAPWPPADGVRDSQVALRLRSIPSTTGEIWPVRWNPASGELRIVTKARYTLSHGGPSREFAPMSKERARMAAASYLNWEVVESSFPFGVITYEADFWILYPDTDYADELAPFVAQKKARGFRVTETTVTETGDACCEIREALSDWLATVPPERDAYALLVGDADVIPLCDAPTGVPTDDLYGSPDGDDLHEEIYVGRLSVDNEADAASQIAKILEYEDNPSQFCCYDRAALWAHKEDAPGKYVGAHETVRTATYAVPPTFSTHYGHQMGVTDAVINDRVDDGVGVLAYRGHGSSSSTATGWNLPGEYYNSTDATALANLLSRSPVVWSFACSNAALWTGDSISEVWMEQPDHAAVSYYGATVPSYTSQNHVLDEWMFKAVYDQGLVTQSHAIQRGEAQMALLSGSDNAWMYLLLGDPDLQIRRRNPKSLILEGLDEILACKPPCGLFLRVEDEVGNPVPEALVGLWKAGPQGGDEVFVNRYADADGQVTLEVSPATAGALYYAVEDGEGNALFGSIEIGGQGQR